MSGQIVHRVVDAAPEFGVRNSQPEGIGRVAALPDLVCWNNLGRNVVFADAMLRPLAVFGTTLFPDDDLASQFDLDVHAILDFDELGMVLVANHFGLIRGFDRGVITGSFDSRPVEPSRAWSFVADVERIVVAGGRIVGSSPRSEGAIGLVVSAPLADSTPDGSLLSIEPGGADLGEVTALGVVESNPEPMIAVGGDGVIALVPALDGRIGRPRWHARIGFRAATVTLSEGRIFAAGPANGHVDDYDWEGLSGGGFAVLDPLDGSIVASGQLPDGVAWGTGGTAVAPLSSSLAAVDRYGRLGVVDIRAGSGSVWTETGPITQASMGIGHMAVVGNRVLCGFNRGGYELYSFCSSNSP